MQFFVIFSELLRFSRIYCTPILYIFLSKQYRYVFLSRKRYEIHLNDCNNFSYILCNIINEEKPYSWEKTFQWEQLQLPIPHNIRMSFSLGIDMKLI